jgi:hypothetical protein
MIVEGFDNAWHILRHWRARGYEYFALSSEGKALKPRPCRAPELPAGATAGLDYFLIPPLSDPPLGDAPDPERSLTAAEVLLATAIAEGWEPYPESESP